MYRYAQIDAKTGAVVGDMHLSGKVSISNLIHVPETFDLTNKRYVNGEWVDYTLEPAQEMVNAEILLNQAEILNNHNAADEVLAEILLNQMEG